jgi:putative serine protease PepD
VFAVTVRTASTSDRDVSAHLPAPPATNGIATTPMPLTAVAGASQSRVVTVEVDTDRGERFGTGWLLDGKGDVVTNNHVIERQRAVRIVDRAGASHGADVVGVDAVQDVALVRSRDGIGAAPLAVATTAAAVGEAVVVLASARATNHGDTTMETVARLHDSITVNPDPSDTSGGDIHYDDMLVLRGAPVYQGNSGGPVLDDLGVVIGIVTATSSTLPEAYAIPIGRVIDELRSFAARGAGGG